MLRARFGPFDIDVPNRRLLRDGREVTLAPKTFDLLTALVSRPGELVTKDELMQRLWPGTFVEEGNLTQQMFVLRKALGQGGDEQTYIATVPKAGYRFVAALDPMVEVAPEPVPMHGAGAGRTRGAWVTRVVVVAVCLAVAGAAWWLWGSGRDPLAGRVMTRLTATGDAGDVAISADGRFVAYVRTLDGRSSVWVHQRATGQASRLVDESVATIPSISFSPDGERVMFVRAGPRPAWWSVPVVGGEARQVLSGFYASPALSPDGRMAAVIRADPDSGAHRVDIVTMETGASSTVLTRQRPAVIAVTGGVTWSPRGTHIAVVTNESYGGREAAIVAVDVRSGASEVVAEHLPWNSGRLTWLPDDSGFLLSARRLYFVNRRTGAHEPITHDAADYPAVSVSAAGVVVARRQEEDSAVWRLPEGGSATSATPWFTERGFNHALSWLPDGRVAYESWTSGDAEIWISPREAGRGPQRLTSATGYDAFPSADADGTSVVYVSGADGGSTLWRAPLDGRPAQRIGAAGAHYAPDVSPDGRAIVYHAGDALLGWSLWQANADGRDARVMTDRPATFGVYSPDGQWVACNWLPPGPTLGYVIALLPAGGGPPVRTLPIPGAATRRLAWSRDGRSIFWTDTRSTLRQVDVATGVPRTVVSYPGEQILTLSVSRHTGELAFVRYTSQADLVIWQ